MYHSELTDFLLGNNKDPEYRIARRGVPNHRTQFRTQVLKVINDPSFQQIKRARKAARSFSYERLNFKDSGSQVRLLRIHPQRIEEPVVCELYVVDLESVKNKFEALSYVWGDGELDQIISIHCVEIDEQNHLQCGPAQDFAVRTNLHQALKNVRHTTKYINLWVDAICIDQRENSRATAEKDMQLSMMSKIYNSAKSVCIWLGDRDEQTSKALSFIQEISNFEQLEACLRSGDDVTIGQWRTLIKTLQETQWFSRRWIIQEIASARSASVHCGDHVVHWDDLAVAISSLEENQAMLERNFSSKAIFAQVSPLSATQLVRSLTQVCRQYDDGEIAERLLDLETLVCTFQQFQARFPEDVIHSVRALASDPPGSKESDLSMDSMTSTPDLFIAFVHRCIERSGSRDIICRHWAPPVTDNLGERIRLPSWISELTNRPFGLPGTSHERQNGENFVAISPIYPHRGWKQYNASGDWKAEQDEQFSQRNRRTRESVAYTRRSTGPFAVFTPSKDINGTVPADDDDAQSYQTTGSEVGSNANTEDEFPSRDLIQEPRPLLHRGISFRPVEEATTPNNVPSSKGHKRSATAPSRGGSKGEVSWSPISSASIKPIAVKTYIQKFKQELHHTQRVGYLNVPGFVLGTVESRSDKMREGVIPGDWIAKLRQDGNHRRATVPDRLWRTLVADRTENGSNLPEWYKKACLHCLEDSRFVNSQGDLNTNKSLSDSLPDSMTSKYLERAKSVVWRRRFIQLQVKTADGSETVYGLGPENCKKGDITCIISGCTVPVILRKIEEPSMDTPDGSAGAFTLIGEAYVHGKMNGEAVKDHEFIKKLKKTFELR
ncbi:hypothetical protein J4E86_010098 [Alternaria arbusti]|uniref:uncharacterized protein n=1 Tax=Alternaria arbusti TaxID=232088 RepID=UPI002220D305|nr:uncharacterized protein J4E86_010098 [Alternaria arbusti]KAI4942296.1 hypothetical protein J4E86_010098 [Alternaria arbusti]